MSYLIQAAAALAAELFLFYLIGGLVPFGKESGERFAVETMCAGYLMYSALFEMVYLIFALTRGSLTLFSCVWSGCAACLAAVSLVARPRTRFLCELPEDLKNHRFHPVCAVMVFAVMAAAVYAATKPAVDDSALTVSRMASNLLHDSVGGYDPASGEALDGLPLASFLAGRYVHGDYVAMLSGLPVKAAAKYFAVMRNVILSFLVIYRVLARLLKKRGAAAACVSAAIGICLFLRLQRAPSFMLFEQGWTGDAEFAAVLIPSLILTAILIARGGGTRLWFLLFLEGITALSLSPFSVRAFPFLTAVIMIPAAVRAGKASGFLRLVLCLVIPSAAAYFVISSNPTVPFM